MHNRPTAPVRVLAAGIATAAALTALTVVPAEAMARRPPGPSEACSDAIDGKTVTTTCKNNGTRTIEFMVKIVCGWSPDLTSGWTTIAPGESDSFKGTCGGTGVGAVVVNIRDV
ncbi:MAG: hypothetical protein HOY71_46410 [Nonomuraea sp.]|nr:hypothetical protein [Nonomuraea sp.]